MSNPIICVFGSANAVRGEPPFEEARELGRAIAEAGWTLCNGGYGGIMEATALGAHEASGHTIGVTCRTIGRGGPNRYIRQEVPTFDLFSRVNTLMRLGWGYVVLPGGTGTLLEIAAVWEHLNKKFLRRTRPLVLLGEFWRPVCETVQASGTGSLQPFVATDVAAAIAILRDQLGEPDPDGDDGSEA